MQLRDLIRYLEQIAPLSLQENYDNAGLITGNPEMEISGALVCLDSTPEVIREAVDRGLNLVIAHHPIVFSGLKKLTGKNYVEQALILAIKHDIAIYAIHTNLDNVLQNGVNQKMAQKLGLTDLRILRPLSGHLLKLVVYCPETHADAVKDALFAAGAGRIGKYDSCSFSSRGEGSFRAGPGSDPHIGRIGELHREPEQRIEVVLPRHLKGAVVRAMLQAHPYEEVAYDLYALENAWSEAGSGLFGRFPAPVVPDFFLEKVKSLFGTSVIRHTALPKQSIETVALCGGSGSFLLQDAIAAGAQVFLSSDFKYHQFFDAEGKILIADIGHYEAEYYTIELLAGLIQKNFSTFAVVFSGINTNPIKYYC